MFIRRYHGEIIFHLLSLFFFDLIYFMALMLLLIRESPWVSLFSILVFGYLHLICFRKACRDIRWPFVIPHMVFPLLLLLMLIAFLTYAP